MAVHRSIDRAVGFAEILGRHKEAHGEKPAPIAAAAIRQRGKSADPGFVKLTCYVRKEPTSQ